MSKAAMWFVLTDSKYSVIFPFQNIAKDMSLLSLNLTQPCGHMSEQAPYVATLTFQVLFLATWRM